MENFKRLRTLAVLAAMAACFTMVAVDFAEARRGGGFGSRGARTFERPAPTRTAPDTAAPINRSMTPRQQQTGTPAQATRQGGTAQAARGGMFGGMFGGLLGGLMLGGLIGLLLGNGLGGLAGFLGLLLQVGLIVVGVMLIMRLLRGRQGALAGATAGAAPAASPYQDDHDAARTPYSAAPPGGGSVDVALSGAAAPSSSGIDEIGLGGEDYDAFEQLLVEVQAAFTREDYAALRQKCTPEIVSYLSEELSQNALNGQRNEVTDVSLLQGDLAEAWREGEDEYATVAMRYSSVDVMRDRSTGEVVAGTTEPSEVTEIWTFVRSSGGPWKLSAIQDVA